MSRLIPPNTRARIQAQKNEEKLLDSVTAQFWMPVAIQPDLHDISEDFFVASDKQQIFYVKLPRLEEAKGKRLSSEPPVQHVGLMHFGQCIEALRVDQENELLIALVIQSHWVGSYPEVKGGEVEIYIAHFPSGNPHPRARKTLISAETDPFPGIEHPFRPQISICDDQFAVVLPGKVLVYNWMTGECLLNCETTSWSTQSITFLSPGVLAVGICGLVDQRFDVWTTTAESGPGAFYTFTCSFYLPRIRLDQHTAMSMRFSSFRPQRKRETRESKRQPPAILTITTEVSTITSGPGSRAARAEWVIDVKGLLDTLASFIKTQNARPQQDRHSRLPWHLWGPSNAYSLCQEKDREEWDQRKMNSSSYFIHTLRPTESLNESEVEFECVPDKLEVFTLLPKRVPPRLPPGFRSYARFRGWKGSEGFPVYKSEEEKNSCQSRLEMRRVLDLHVAPWMFAGTVLLDDWGRFYFLEQASKKEQLEISTRITMNYYYYLL